MKMVDLILHDFSPGRSQLEVADYLGYAGGPLEFYFTTVTAIKTRYLTFFDQIDRDALAPELYTELVTREVDRITDALYAEFARRHPDIVPRIRSITTVNSQVHLIPTPAEKLLRKGGLPDDVDLCHVNGACCSSTFQPIRMILDRERLVEPGSGYHLIIGVELPSITLRRKRDLTRTDRIVSDMIVSDGAFLLLLGPDDTPTAHPMPRIQDLASYFAPAYAFAADSFFEGPIMQYRLDIDYVFHMGFVLQEAVPELLDSLGLSLEQVVEIIVHPGGKQVLDMVSASLDIDSDRLHRCYRTVEEGGNRMSTLIWYALDRYLKDGVLGDGRGSSIAMGFGPGTNIEIVRLA